MLSLSGMYLLVSNLSMKMYLILPSVQVILKVSHLLGLSL